VHKCLTRAVCLGSQHWSVQALVLYAHTHTHTQIHIYAYKPFTHTHTHTHTGGRHWVDGSPGQERWQGCWGLQDHAGRQDRGESWAGQRFWEGAILCWELKLIRKHLLPWSGDATLIRRCVVMCERVCAHVHTHTHTLTHSRLYTHTQSCTFIHHRVCLPSTWRPGSARSWYPSLAPHLRQLLHETSPLLSSCASIALMCEWVQSRTRMYSWYWTPYS